MIGVVVVTHGQLATELLNAAETIVGDMPGFAAVSIGWHEDTEDARREIEQAVARVDKGGGALILTDMFGGTPSNLAMSFLAQGRVGSHHRRESADAYQVGESVGAGGRAHGGARDPRAGPQRHLGGI